MPCIRLVFLWHMHQPFYKDLVTGEYRLPWVRLHALKDYYGMVKLLDEFPEVHQTFNLVPSLIEQIQDYVSGTARDPFFRVASKPAQDLTPEDRRFALAYLFQTNPAAIARYPRYQELLQRFRGLGESPERAWTRFDKQDYTDLQVLSQIAWFDEYFLEDPDIAALIEKGSSFDESDQALTIARELEILSKVLPAHAEAAQRGSIEISTSPHYHPILPLLCDTDAGGISTPGLRLPQRRFRHPEDARTQLERGLALHERTFGLRPRGAWPSEGSVSEQVLEIACQLGFEWLATDEGVLGRSIGYDFAREGNGRLSEGAAQRLYRVYRYEKGPTQMHMLFRDHVLSDLIGFVYSGMPAEEAAENFIQRIKSSARPVLDSGRDAVVPIILDGENAWEYYPQSGREFLRRLYDGFQRDPQIQAVTVSEAIHGESTAELPTTRGVTISVPAALANSPQIQQAALSLGPVRKSLPDRRHFARLDRLVPGSWINANFNVWIGAPEDNRAWDYLSAARDFYANHGITASDAQRALAFEEILIAEGSDWNWWYGPEHHSANDRDFDELYRKHLSNVYLALNARPPDYLAQPILFEQARPEYTPQTGYIHPRIGAEYERYFEWMGAAMYTADRRAGAMHGKQFLLDSVYAGVDEENLYGRLDFASLPEGDFELRVTMEALNHDGTQSALTLEVAVDNRAISLWMLRRADDASVLATMNGANSDGIAMSLRRNFAFKLPLAQLHAGMGTNVRLRFALWCDRLPLDALPVEGWLELLVAPEEELEGGIFNYSVHS